MATRKASKCRVRGLFVAATDRQAAFIGLGGGEMPKWLIGGRPSEHEPPEGVPPPDPTRRRPARRAWT